MMEISPYKKIATKTYSIPSQSPGKESAFSNQPFELISHQPHYQQFSKPVLSNFHKQKNNDQFYLQTNDVHLLLNKEPNQLANPVNEHTNIFMLQTYDLYRNPMIQSIDGDFPELIESRMINNQSLPFNYYYYPNHQYGQYYPNHQSVQNYPNHQSTQNYPNQMIQKQHNKDKNNQDHLIFSKQKSQNEPNINSRNMIQMPPQQKFFQPNIKNESNLLEDQEYDEQVFNVVQNYRKIHLNQQNKLPSHQYETQRFSDQANQKILSKNSFQSQQQANQKSLIANEDISEVKYRLDQLMSKFPIENFQTDKKDVNLKKKKPASDLIAQRLQMKRTNSINQNQSFSLQSNFNKEASRRNPQTQGKILISNQSESNGITYGSQELLVKNRTQSKAGYSLNYSESGIKSNGEIIIPKPDITTLYQHMRQQEQVIYDYKRIITRLQDQNAHFLRIIQNQSKSIEPNQIQNFNSISDQYFNNSRHTQNNHFLQYANPGHKNSCLSDSFHKFQRESSNHSKLDSYQIQNLQLRHNDKKSPKVKSSSKISSTLQQQVDILRSQKSQLLKKIDWLNAVVQEMINMGNKTKNQSSQILENLQSSIRNSKRSRQLSGDLGKVSKIIQTSFIQSTTILNGQNLNYKQLYEKQIQNHQSMKNQMNQLLEIQNAYSAQFHIILKEISEIKRNRAYYQELKKEIQKSKEKSFKKQENDLRFKSPVVRKEKKETSKKIFENQLIYQLKSENQILLSKYLGLKELYFKQKAVQKNLNYSTKQPNILTQTIQAEDSFVALIDRNILQQKVLQKDRKTNKNNQIVSEKNGEINRPASYGDFNILKTNTSGQSRIKSFENRKNGTIYSSSHVKNFKKTTKQLIESNQFQEQFNHERKDPPNLVNQNQDIKYKQRKWISNEARSRITQRSLEPRRSAVSHRIMEEEKEKLSNWTNESSQNMIGRYNSFIKNMKKRFGINSSIIGKQISIH